MPALFCIVGTTDPYYEGRVGRACVWPVAYRVSREDAEAVLKICENEQAAFLRELEPIWETIDENMPRDSWTRRARQSPEQWCQENDQRRARQRAARAREAAACEKFAGSMLDPLFPSTTNGKPSHTVVYKILEFWDDPREMGALALMKLRAKLHGLTNDEIDEDDDT